MEDDSLAPILDGTAFVGVELLTTLPMSDDEQPFARVQEVVPVPGMEGAYAALDTRGVVWLVEDGVVRDAPLIDLRDNAVEGFVEPGPEAGLRSIAFHPDFAREGEAGFGTVYLAYSATEDSAPDGVGLFTVPQGDAVFHDVVAEFQVDDPADPVADLETARELFRIEQPFGNHNFGQLAFNPEAEPGDADYGNLYLSVGDGGSANDPFELGGDLLAIHGKILRIDPLGGEPGQAYRIPDENPFAFVDNALSEIIAYGFRNPQQFSFADGLIFTGDIGQNTIEEIDVVAIGGDHGWDRREGTYVSDDGLILPPVSAEDDTLQYPITQYAHSEITTGNAAVAGGFVYQGDDIPELQGSYVFANFPTGEMFTLPLHGLEVVLADNRVDPTEVREPLRLGLVDDAGLPTSFAEISGNASGRVDLRFAETPEGELLAFSKQSGNIYRLTDGGVTGAGLADDDAKAVALLYETALDRDGEIDLPGLNFWIDVREAGFSEAELAAEFLASDEFSATFGDPDSFDDRGLVELFYRNVLNREGEAEGIEFWVAAVGDPEFGRDDLLFAFATSPENRAELPVVETLDEIAPGYWEFA